MSVPLMPVVLDSFTTVSNGLIESKSLRIYSRWNRLEYSEDSWRSEESYSHSYFSEYPQVKPGIKVSSQIILNKHKDKRKNKTKQNRAI